VRLDAGKAVRSCAVRSEPSDRLVSRNVAKRTSTRTRSGGLSRAATTAAMPLSTASAANPELSRASRHSCSVAESVPLADDAIGFDNIFHSRPGRGIVQRVRDLAQVVKARFESLMILVQFPCCRR
jgi:hypothetical protein